MQWVTYAQVGLDRAACVWLIRRHLDPQAEIAYLDEQTLAAAVAAGALPFHLTTQEEGADPERTSFSLLLAEYKLDQADPALVLLGQILADAELQPSGGHAEATGIRAVAAGMAALAHDDGDQVARLLPIWEALYTECRRGLAGQGDWANGEES